MEHTPEEYGEYWAGSIRIAVGVVLVLLTHRLVRPFLELDPWLAQLLGWFVLAGAVLVGTFAASIGLARVVSTASR